MNKTAIVIGATGLIGKELVTQLSHAEHISKVISITRKAVEYSSNNIDNHVVDFDDLGRVAILFKGDMLFSCLGTTAKQAGSIHAQRVVDLEYQYKAAELAASQGVTDYFLVSSSGANQRSLSAYFKMKGELEARVKKLNFQSVYIFQPSLLLGKRTKPRFAEGIASKFLPTLCQLPGLKRYRPIYGAQVAAKMVSVSRQPKGGITVIKLDDIF